MMRRAPRRINVQFLKENTMTKKFDTVAAVKNASREHVGIVPPTKKIPNKKRQSRQDLRREVREIIKEF